MSDIDVIIRARVLEEKAKENGLNIDMDITRINIFKGDRPAATLLVSFISVDAALTYVEGYKDGVMYG